MTSSSTGTSLLDDSIQYNLGLCYEDMMAEMEDDLICSLCESLFEDPQLLSCTHNFCKDCLEQLVRSNTQNRQTPASNIKCPVCRMENLTEGPEGPKSNFLLKSIVENFSKMKAIPRPPLCEVHAGQPLNMFCTTDMKLICGLCATSEEHKQHTFSSIAEAFKQEKSTLEELLLCLKNQEDDVLSCRQTLERNKAMALRVLSEKAEKIKLYFVKYQNDLDQRKNKVLSEITGMEKAVKQTYDPEIRKVIALMIEHKKAQRILQNCRETSEPYRFLNHRQKLQEKMASIKRSPLPSIPDDPISPAMKAFDPRMWDNQRLRNLNPFELPLHNPVKQCATSWPLRSLWAVLVPVLIFTLMAMVCYSVSFSSSHVEINTYISPVSSYLSDTTGKAAEYVTVYARMLAAEIYNMAGRCQMYITGLMEHAAQSVLSFIWRKDQGTILYLGMEETATPAPPADIPSSMVLSQSRELQTVSHDDHALTVHHYINVARSYLTTVILQTAAHIYSYWWYIVQRYAAWVGAVRLV
uniref:Uncharacterized protein n=1 Tax=Leptobrachium leishanense TaxID=445787 RepID=A0A8C5Q5P5_9ANUR